MPFTSVLTVWVVAISLGFNTPIPVSTEQAPSPVRSINLAERFAAGTLRPANRGLTRVPGNPDAVHVNKKAEPGIVWLEGSDFAEGTIEVDVRVRDVFQQSFVGIAFHGQNDNVYEALYVRPFNFRAVDPVRHEHAVQYMALPDYDWPRLRQQFPDEFESSIDPSIVPTDWVHLRITVKGKTIQAYVGPVPSPTLQVRKLGQHDRGMIGLWTGNGSDGDFAHLRIAPSSNN